MLLFFPNQGKKSLKQIQPESDRNILGAFLIIPKENSNWTLINPFMNCLHKQFYGFQNTVHIILASWWFWLPCGDLIKPCMETVLLSVANAGWQSSMRRLIKQRKRVRNSPLKTQMSCIFFLFFFTHQEETQTPLSTTQRYYSKYK